MNTSDNNWWLIEAGEYVLGTLRDNERDLFEKVLQRDPQAREFVEFWERHLGKVELVIQNNEESANQTLTNDHHFPEHIWQNISASIDQEALDNGSPFGTTSSNSQTSHQNQLDQKKPVESIGVHQSPVLPQVIQLRRWRGLASLSLAASVVMGAYLVHQNTLKTQDTAAPFVDSTTTGATTGFNVVSILRDEAGNDLWAILAETTTGDIRAIALQAQPDSDQSHQLWVVLPDSAGVQSVGILPYGNGNVELFTLPTIKERDRLEQGAAFAVSLEPAGGTDEPAPTGPVISSREYTRLNEEI